jgi:hypothetical protein
MLAVGIVLATLTIAYQRGGAAIAWLVTNHRWFVVIFFLMQVKYIVKTTSPFSFLNFPNGFWLLSPFNLALTVNLQLLAWWLYC